METFLGNVASFLYGEYGDNISSVGIILPNVRSRLFLLDELGHLIQRPLWQPRYYTIEDMMGKVSGLAPLDRVRGVVELYKIYSKYHQENLDSFYFWGETLLDDFDQVDQYMVDAKMLFTNLSDLKNIDGAPDYFSSDQKAVIRRFWESFGAEEDYSSEKRDFLRIWQSLGTIYQEFQDRLLELGLAYPGMMERVAAERIKAGNFTLSGCGPYAVVGFNALSKCEKVLFDHLQNSCGAEFFWDCDDYYLSDKRQEAGSFIRENMLHYPQPQGFRNRSDNFIQPKNVSVVSAPSGVLQCKQAADFLRRVVERGEKMDKKTAIVLTDESLLVPLLYSLPKEAGMVNVTMGYPLRQTLAYSFVERLLRLQTHTRMKSGETSFYHADVSGILTHPFIMELDAANASEINAEITSRSMVYVRESVFRRGTIIQTVFAKKDEWMQVSDWIIEVLSAVAASFAAKEDRRMMNEYAGMIADTLRRLANSIESCGVEVEIPVFASLVRRMLQIQRVPYEGEPLQGVQIMGILETRNLDFDNVMVLSMNDDNFPGASSSSSSFIPYNLRLGYGLPTPQLNDGIYGYYFYRLLQRASNIELVYNSRNDDNSSGEQSRYIYQLEYESPHRIIHKDIGLDIGIAAPESLSVDKDAGVVKRLGEYLDGGGATISPTALNTYLSCPLKFYFRYIAGLQAEEEVSEEIDMPLFGTILHKTMELLYRPIVGLPEPAGRIGSLIGSGAVDGAVDRAIGEAYFRGDTVSSDEYEGNVLMVRDIVIRYVNGSLLPFDSRLKDYTITALERRLTADFHFKAGQKQHFVTFSGLADRMDRLPDSVIRIVDYKTGSPHADFAGMGTLFGENSKDRDPAVLQTLLYSLIVTRMQQKGEIEGREVCPSLYYVRLMNRPDYSPLLNIGDGKSITAYQPYRSEFELYLAELLSELFDPSKPFRQCEDSKPCGYCDFTPICRRK